MRATAGNTVNTHVTSQQTMQTTARKPRPGARLPEGGLALFRQLQRGERPRAFITALPNPRTKERRAACDHTLVYEEAWDPGVYFWPVEGCVVVAYLNSATPEQLARMGRVLRRDGAEVVYLVTGMAAPFTIHVMGEEGPEIIKDPQWSLAPDEA